MRKKELIPFIKDYDALFTSFWSRDKATFLRLEGDWIQYVDFRTGPLIDNYVPVHAMSFVKDVAGSAPLIGSYLVDDLHDPRSAYERSPWKIEIRDHAQVYREVYGAMCKQFVPNIERPINPVDIETEMKNAVPYWPYFYALTVIELERGKIDEARFWMDTFRQKLPRSWEEFGKESLAKYLDLARSNPEQLRLELDEVRKINIANLTAKKTSEPRIARLILKE